MRNKVLSIVMSIVLVVGLCPGLAFADEGSAGRDLVAFDPGTLTAQSDDSSLSTQAELASTEVSNAWGHDYVNVGRWAVPPKSFLHENGGNLERVQYTGSELVVETVSSDYKGVTAQKTIPASTYQPSNLVSGSPCLWGGFFSGSSHNYVVTGQSNTDEDNNLVVFRITKYTKDWTYVSAAEVRGANTSNPFQAGSCDMVESGGTLYVRTSHQMYTSDDGLRHQANVQLMVDESSMSVTGQYTGVAWQGNGGGYVSHSFNQHLAVLSGSVYGLDHGDAYPRAATVKKMNGGYADVLAANGTSDSNGNDTGISTGGFESSSSAGKLLSVGSRTADGSTSYRSARNVWIATTSEGPGSSSVRNLTSYTSSSAEWADNPFLVKVNENRFLVMWGLKSSYSTHTGKIAYQFVDGNGNALSSIMTQQGTLSDCEPVLHDGSIVWYAGNGGKPSYYSIDATSGAYSVVESISSATMTVEGADSYSYDYGSGQWVKGIRYDSARTCPPTTLTLNGRTLVENSDYTLKYTVDRENAKGVVTAVGKGALAGDSKSVEFSIAPYPLSWCTISGISDVEYTGGPITQKITVKDSNETFTQGVDFTVSYSNNTAVGTATVTITGKGVLSGSVDRTFEINKASLSGATVSNVQNGSYTGAAQTQSPTVKVGGRTLTSGTDYTLSYSNNTNAGTATMVVTGKGNYTDSKTVTFKISKAKVSSVTVSPTSYTYDGKAKSPTATVKGSNGKTLASGTDYTLSFANNTAAGTASATAAGKGNYEGSAKAEFTIKPASVSKATVTLSPASYSYNGKAKTPAARVELGGRVLKAGTDYTVAYKNNVNVGTATATVTGKGNYTGKVDKTFTIAKGNLSKAEVTLKPTAELYTGRERRPAVTVELGGRTLEEDVDYTVSYKNNVEVGTATATVTGKGSYTGSKSATFTIDKEDISAMSIKAYPKTFTYDGTAKEPLLTITGHLTFLNPGRDFDATYTNNVNVGTATATATGKGYYKGECSVKFEILQANLADATVTLSPASYTYDGKAKMPGVTVKLGDNKLPSSDYTVAYKDNTAAGTATVTVTGKGNCTGSKSATFKIARADLSKAKVTLSPASYSYNGKAKTPAARVELGGRVLKAGTDYTVAYKNNTAVGTATATITGKGNYTGKVDKTFTIAKGNLSKAEVTLSQASCTYDGTAKKPTATVKLDGRTLKAGTDYTVSYKNNTAVGTATATVTGKGSYAGSKSETFKIVPPDVSKADVTLSPSSFSYDGAAKRPSVTVMLGGRTLKAGTDYTVSYKDNVNVGKATATVTGKGSYTGTKSASFTITKGDVSGATVKVAAAGYTYDGKAKEPSVTVTLGGRTLKAGTDYTVSYKDNTAAGTATVTATGKGSFAGSKSAPFKISRADLSKAKVTLTPASFVHDGKAKMPAARVELGGRVLKAGTDYTVAYRNNTAVGTATATVTGKGNYTGKVDKAFTIARSKAVKRLWGKDALKTMSAIVDEGGFSKGGTVMVATSEGFHDALTAAGYAGLADAPVLLTKGSSLSPETAAQLRRLAPSRVVICGGPAAVSEKVEGQLRAAAPGAEVKRAWGADAIATANAVALAAVADTGRQFSGAAFVATPNGYWDALAAAPVAYATGSPVFLAGFDGRLGAETLAAMKEVGVERVYIAGGPEALPASVEAQVRGAGMKVERRFAGDTAVDTSQKIAAFGVSSLGLSADGVGVATRDGYWDALCGAALCGHNRSVLVLAADDDRSAVSGFVRANAAAISTAYVFGGPAAVSDATLAAVRAAIR